MNSFIKLPKSLFESEKYAKLSLEAKVLYALMLDRSALSTQNDWVDTNGQVYIYFTASQACEYLGKSLSKITKIMSELESFRLITRKKQGQGKPSRIYVLSVLMPISQENRVQTNSKEVDLTSQDTSQTTTNNTNINKTDISNLSHLCDEEREYEISKNILDNKGLPYDLMFDAVNLRIALMSLVEYSVHAQNAKNSFEYQEELGIIDIFIEALTEMLKGASQINGYRITKEEVYHKLNKMMTFHNYLPSISDVAYDTISAFKSGASKQEIKRPIAYMKSCIWNTFCSFNSHTHLGLLGM